MTFRYSETLRNAALDARIKALGPNPVLKLFDTAHGDKSSTDDADPGEMLVLIHLPEPWMNKAVNGAVMKRGLWSAPARTAGEAKSYRFYDAQGQCHIQGDIPADMQIDNPVFREGQNVAVQVFVIASGNG